MGSNKVENKRKMSVRVSCWYLIISLILLLIYPLYWLVSIYIHGDQWFYREFYSAIERVEVLEDVFYLARYLLTSREIVSPFVLFVGAKLGIDKDVYITALNLILIFVTILLFRRHQVSWLIKILFITGFYYVVMYTAAERLKIGFIFLITGYLFQGATRWFFFSISFLAHFQMSLYVMAYVIYNSEFNFRVLTGRISKRLFCTAIVLLVLLVFSLMNPYIIIGLLGKANSYFKVRDVSQLFQLALLAVSVLPFYFVKPKIYRYMLVLGYFSVIIILLGGERINMIAYMFFSIHVLTEVRFSVSNPKAIPLLMIMVYFTLKSVPFVHMVMLYGNGFVKL